MEKKKSFTKTECLSCDMPQFTVQTSHFEGPLDLLLSLIQGRKLYINELSLSEVTDDYLQYISNTEKMPIGETAQFVLVAATLLLIKSRSLLPSLELTQEEEESIEELERRLAQYKLVKQAAKNISNIWGSAPLVLSKGASISNEKFLPGETKLSQVIAAAKTLVEALPTMAFKETANIAPVVSLEEMIENLSKRFVQAARTSFGSLTAGASKEEVVVHFLALLEILKGGSIFASQSGTFGDIMVESDNVGTPRYGD